MLPSRQRLSRVEVTSFLKNPEIKVIFNRLGTLKYISTRSNLAMLTVVTGSKQQKKAVLRNKLRRRLYSIFSKNPYNIRINAMIYVSKQSYDLSFSDIKDLLYALLSKIEKTS